ncbi:uncharacterized protein LOC118415207 [Branchiostoma floridae]|uniref:Uncharacterized protein LOC118415207 n=1 Tax=Branchiostoma floridae TaxID=7739 RepID=A0A9J7L4T4_BRAFL|nr:uncharacterized protein LOC118415207 [Branchiostoma floridae]
MDVFIFDDPEDEDLEKVRQRAIARGAAVQKVAAEIEGECEELRRSLVKIERRYALLCERRHEKVRREFERRRRRRKSILWPGSDSREWLRLMWTITALCVGFHLATAAVHAASVWML